jgi:hypothetical protein
MIQTIIQPGFWWHPPRVKATRDISQTMMSKMLKCVTDNPGLTCDAIAEKCDSTTHYTRVNQQTMFLLPTIAICVYPESFALEIAFLGFAVGVEI